MLDLDGMADREGFEPSNGFHRYTLSRRAPSTTRPPVRDEGEYTHRAGPASPVKLLGKRAFSDSIRVVRRDAQIALGGNDRDCVARHDIEQAHGRDEKEGRCAEALQGDEFCF